MHEHAQTARAMQRSIKENLARVEQAIETCRAQVHLAAALEGELPRLAKLGEIEVSVLTLARRAAEVGAIQPFFLISGATMLLFWALVRSFEPKVSTMRTLQFVFFPLLFPFWFLIYTDVYALLWLLLAILALTRDRVHVSGILMIVSVLVRQTYIVWLALLGLWTVTVAAPPRQLATRGTSFGIGAGLFLLFVMANGGIAVGDRESNPDFVFHTENLLFMLLCFFVMFLPLILSTLPQIARLRPALLVGVLLSSVVLSLFRHLSRGSP